MRRNIKPLELNSFLPYQLSLLSNTVSSTIAATYQDKFAISMPEWRLMMVLAEKPDISADDVCKRTHIEKSVISRAVGRLLERHLITRKFDEKDRRRSILRLSEAGMEIYGEVLPVAKSIEKSLFAGLSRQECKALSSLLNKLQERAATLADQEDKPG